MSSGILAGKRALVTGGSGGIGRGICEVLAREGARVAFTYHGNKTDPLGDGLAIAADLRTRDAATDVVKQIEAAWGGIDILVNNAAVSEAVPFVLVDDDQWDDLIALNVTGVFRLCRAAVRGMIRQKYGRIVNIGSIAGTRSIASPVHYATSKGAIEGMTHSLAHELGRYGVLTNCISAGIFEGGLRSTIPEHHQRRYIDACALGRIGQPAECGELVAFLASERNTYLNGAVIVLDGGTLS